MKKFRTIKIDEDFYNIVKKGASALDTSLSDFMQLNFFGEEVCGICGLRKSLHYLVDRTHKFKR